MTNELQRNEASSTTISISLKTILQKIEVKKTRGSTLPFMFIHLFGCLGANPVVLMVYFWLYAQESCQAVLGNHMGCQRANLGQPHARPMPSPLEAALLRFLQGLVRGISVSLKGAENQTCFQNSFYTQAWFLFLYHIHHHTCEQLLIENKKQSNIFFKFWSR